MSGLPDDPQFSLVIPVYRNVDDIAELLDAVELIASQVEGRFEAVFVVDGSPDRSYEVLSAELPNRPFPSQLMLHSRNFGSFAAIRTGLTHANGNYFANMAADLQDPPDLLVSLFKTLNSRDYEVAVGTRISRRGDPWLTRLLSTTFWRLYRRLVQPELPPGGVDVFACNRDVRDVLLSMREAHSNLVSLLFWSGFRRTTVPYERRKRPRGSSSWTLGKKLRYFADSVFSVTDVPIRILWLSGTLGMLAALILGAVVAVARITGQIEVPGYSATVLSIIFFSSMNLLGLGIIGSYVWRGYENSKGRPEAIVMRREQHPGELND